MTEFIKKRIDAVTKDINAITVKDVIDALNKENPDAVIQSIGTVSGSHSYRYVFHLKDGSEIRV